VLQHWIVALGVTVVVGFGVLQLVPYRYDTPP